MLRVYNARAAYARALDFLPAALRDKPVAKRDDAVRNLLAAAGGNAVLRIQLALAVNKRALDSCPSHVDTYI